MKNPHQLQAEFNADSAAREERYSEVNSLVTKSLRKSLEIKAAIATYELKLAIATSELENELKTIEENYSR